MSASGSGHCQMRKGTGLRSVCCLISALDSHLLALDSRLAARVNSHLEKCYDRAKAILIREHDTHLWVARTILDHGVLEGNELEALLDQARQRMTRSDTRTESRL